MRKKRTEDVCLGVRNETNGIDMTVDVEKVIADVDDGLPEQAVTSSDLLPDKVFILDLGPIFKLIGVEPEDRPDHDLSRFVNNLLARSFARPGTCEAQGTDIFLFRLNMADERDLRAAIAILNEAGSYFLCNGFNVEDIVWQMVDAVDAAEATEGDGSIDVERALAAQSHRRLAEEDERLAKAARVLAPDSGAGIIPRSIFEQKPKASPPEPTWIAVEGTDRPARMRVKRGPERRDKWPKPIAGPDRRKTPYGRRQSDDPKIHAW
ncbi:MAG: hypothetical protein VYE18_07500 [Pseudomonadota bacterium]|nr:hypothetical protein [Pseudomonadota bacterium]